MEGLSRQCVPPPGRDTAAHGGPYHCEGVSVGGCEGVSSLRGWQRYCSLWRTPPL